MRASARDRSSATADAARKTHSADDTSVDNNPRGAPNADAGISFRGAQTSCANARRSHRGCRKKDNGIREKTVAQNRDRKKLTSTTREPETDGKTPNSAQLYPVYRKQLLESIG